MHLEVKRAATAEAWVAFACDPDHQLEHCRLIYVLQGVVCALDGKRMHWAASQFPDGTYNSETFMPIDYTGRIPDFARLAVMDDDAQAANVADLEHRYRTVQAGKLWAIDLPLHGCVNREFLAQGLNGSKDPIITYETCEHGAKVAGSCEFGAFVIAQVAWRR